MPFMYLVLSGRVFTVRWESIFVESWVTLALEYTCMSPRTYYKGMSCGMVNYHWHYVQMNQQSFDNQGTLAPIILLFHYYDITINTWYVSNPVWVFYMHWHYVDMQYPVTFNRCMWIRFLITITLNYSTLTPPPLHFLGVLD